MFCKIKSRLGGKRRQHRLTSKRLHARWRKKNAFRGEGRGEGKKKWGGGAGGETGSRPGGRKNLGSCVVRVFQAGIGTSDICLRQWQRLVIEFPED